MNRWNSVTRNFTTHNLYDHGMTAHTNHAKRIWEDTPAGQKYLAVKKFYADETTKEKWTDNDQRFVDISRAKSLSRERDITEDFQKRAQELEAEYKQSLEKNVDDQLTEELAYLEAVKARDE